MGEFPFGIDPRGPLPNPDEPIFVKVEGVGSIKFTGPTDTVIDMAATVVAMRSGKALIISDARNVIITGWNPAQRILRVRLS